MRHILISKIQEIKKQEGNFKGEKWKDFFVSYIHISEFNENGMPDELLFDFYEEVMKWHYTKK